MEDVRVKVERERIAKAKVILQARGIAGKGAYLEGKQVSRKVEHQQRLEIYRYTWTAEVVDTEKGGASPPSLYFAR